jgi:hypothetical protein
LKVRPSDEWILNSTLKLHGTGIHPPFFQNFRIRIITQRSACRNSMFIWYTDPGKLATKAAHEGTRVMQISFRLVVAPTLSVAWIGRSAWGHRPQSRQTPGHRADPVRAVAGRKLCRCARPTRPKLRRRSPRRQGAADPPPPINPRIRLTMAPETTPNDCEFMPVPPGVGTYPQLPVCQYFHVNVAASLRTRLCVCVCV